MSTSARPETTSRMITETTSSSTTRMTAKEIHASTLHELARSSEESLVVTGTTATPTVPKRVLIPSDAIIEVCGTLKGTI